MPLCWLMWFALSGLLLTDAWAMETILRDDGSLPSTLTLRETQAGFAGETATILVIRPDGRFCRWRELNGALRGEAKSGQLAAGQLAVLAETLARHDVGSLPDAYGEAPPVNARQLVLSFDGRQSVFDLSPADPSPNPAPEADASAPSARNAAIRQAIIEAIDAAPPAPAEDCPSPE
jgi:hypothetical protein